LLVEFSSEDLTQAVERSPVLHAQIKDPLAAIDRGLMYLHEQDCLILEHGLSIFRQAMTIRLLPESKGRRYTQGDFDPLQRHYQERILQVHVMCEYARRGIESIKQGLQMVLAYFQQPRAEFLNDHFADRQEMLQRAITHEAYQQIVDDLRHPTQQAVVAAAARRQPVDPGRARIGQDPRGRPPRRVSRPGPASARPASPGAVLQPAGGDPVETPIA
jgi:ATP-dependent DNA helicase RecQ